MVIVVKLVLVGIKIVVFLIFFKCKIIFSLEELLLIAIVYFVFIYLVNVCLNVLVWFFKISFLDFKIFLDFDKKYLILLFVILK